MWEGAGQNRDRVQAALGSLVNPSLTPPPCHFDTVNGNFANAAMRRSRKSAPHFLTPEKSFTASTLRFLHKVIDSPPR
jgi:hypothetical protein